MSEHPAELASEIESLQRRHEDSFVAQAGFHPDFARSLAVALKKCFENKPEDYLEDEYSEIREILEEEVSEDTEQKNGEGGPE